MLANYSCERDLTCSTLLTRSSEFPSLSSYQMPTCSQLEMEGLHLHFSLSSLGFCLASACAGLVHAVTRAGSSDVQLPCCISETVFLVVIYHPWLLQPFLSIVYENLPLEGKDVIRISHLGLSTPQSLILLYVEGLWANDHRLQREGSPIGLRGTLIYGRLVGKQ